MDPILEILKIVIPAFIVFLTVFYVLKFFLENESKKRMIDHKAASKELITPIRLQAYERIVLFLERISPTSMIMRVNKPTSTARQLHSDLLVTIRSEFEHNLSQQIYVSNAAWDGVKNAKEEITKLINLVAMKVPENAPSNELANLLFEACGKLTKLPNQSAIELIKKEIFQNF